MDIFLLFQRKNHVPCTLVDRITMKGNNYQLSNYLYRNILSIYKGKIDTKLKRDLVISLKYGAVRIDNETKIFCSLYSQHANVLHEL